VVPVNIGSALSVGDARSVRRWPAALVWATGAVAMAALDGRVDLANLAMLLVLSSAAASLWLPAWASAGSGALAVLAFNWWFVPPRGSFNVDLRQHALLLGAMLVVNTIVSVLMAAQRRAAARATRHALQSEQLRGFGDSLRDAAEPLAHAGTLQTLLAQTARVPVALLISKQAVPKNDDDAAMLSIGDTDADQHAGLWHCLRRGEPLGPGTGRHAELPDWYLPLRGRGACFGAAVLRGPLRAHGGLREHAQALCDQMGLALQRAESARTEHHARSLADAQGVRNALLAAISHDYRTPLATILGAATSLDEQAERLDGAQRRRLARSIADEATRLARLTDNTLQLARLDAPGVQLRCDWESAEEIVGAVLRHARAHDPARRLRARLEPDLPLLWCDALLMAQLLDNLVDNALKYSPDDTPVELLVRRQAEQVVLAVRDRGPGVAPAWRERIFEVFHRGAQGTEDSVAAARPGAGVGLAVCRAIARAHGGELRLRSRAHGGCSFECLLPLRTPPAAPEPEALRS
jgi:two-component system, OmpR family, sensor histidine kinase KdpD